MALDEATLNFMLQEMVSFSNKEGDEEDDGEAEASKKLPNFKIKGTNQEVTAKEIADFLKKNKAK